MKHINKTTTTRKYISVAIITTTATEAVAMRINNVNNNKNNAQFAI